MLKRIAITIPDEALEEVDRAAHERGESRSKFISRVLAEAMKEKRDREITERLDKVFGDVEIAAEQRRLAAELSEVRAGFDDEGW